MRKLILYILLLTTYSQQAQQSISGMFSPAKDYKWLIAYRLEPGSQAYVADTAIKDGKFSLELPADAPAGTYRMVYAVPQETFFFDVIYDGKENVTLSFDADNGVSFAISKNNRLYGNYFKDIQKLERDIIDFYSKTNTDTKTFLTLTQKLKTTQASYEKNSEGLLVGNFIRANHPYVPTSFETLQEYVQNRKQYYFKFLDFKNAILQKSNFLTHKVTNYVFTALPMEKMDLVVKEEKMQKNIQTLETYLQGIDNTYKLHLLYTLWTKASTNSLNTTSDFLYTKYIKNLASITHRQDIINTIESYNRLRLGAVAPEITWKEDTGLKKLSSLGTFKNYVLVFWSSSCSHCLHELPKLHEAIKGNKEVKVVAVGLEDDRNTWEKEAAKINHFHHAIALGKWDSTYAKLYKISQTPTYFILDSEKKIMAKPEDYQTVLTFLERISPGKHTEH